MAGCMARRSVGANDPQDCDYPHCGCDLSGGHPESLVSLSHKPAKAMAPRIVCPYGFNGTQEQLIRALRVHPARESASSRHVKDTAAWFLEFKDSEIDKLRVEIEELRKKLADWEVDAVDV